MGPWAGGSVSWRAAPSGLIKLEAARRTARRMEGANAASTRAAPSLLKATWGTSDELTALYTRGTSDELTVLYSNGPLYTGHCVEHGGGKRFQHEGCLKSSAGGDTGHCIAHGGGKRCQEEGWGSWRAA